MEEDEEIDILGDYDGLVSKAEREISNISAGQILSCDYTVHPRWLDNSDNGDYSNIVVQEVCIENDDGIIYSSEDDYDKSQMTIPSEDEWCNEITVENNIILEDDIPAAVEEEVVTNTIYSEPFAEYQQQQKPKRKSRSLLKIHQLVENDRNIEIQVKIPKPNPRSILKTNLPEYKFKQTLTVDRNAFKTNNKKILQKLKESVKLDKKIIKKGKSMPKFKQSVKMNLRKGDSLLKKRFSKTKITKKSGKTTKNLKSGIVYDENITINHNEETTMVHCDELKKAEEVIPESIKPQDEESDIEIDIESSEPDNLDLFSNIRIESEENNEENIEIKSKVKINQNNEFKFDDQLKENFISNLLTNCDSTLKKILESTEEPKEELILNLNEVTELEKLVHFEFFEGRPTKTPDRYMKIRAHILNTWLTSKPTYLSKTAVRAGLKNCGDVNCFSRIHSLLEQLGAINFGCHGEYFNFIRPLTLLISSFVQPTRQNKITNSSSLIELDRRPRKSINYNFPDSNFTISHINHHYNSNNDEDREFNLLPNKKNLLPNKWNFEYELIKCNQFSENCIAPFKVSITLSTILCLYLHSLSSTYEVMGFLGGYRSKSVGRNKLSIARYKPCETSEQSGTMCEMCPISQVEQSTSLISEGYDLLGWFHSHPLFPPNPSRTDVRTQGEMQLQFSIEDNMPFIGLIIGCINMNLKCMYIMPADIHLSSENIIPYEITVDIIKDCTDFSNNVMDVINLIQKSDNNLENILDKFFNSAEVLLNKFGYDLNVIKFLRAL